MPAEEKRFGQSGMFKKKLVKFSKPEIYKVLFILHKVNAKEIAAEQIKVGLMTTNDEKENG